VVHHRVHARLGLERAAAGVGAFDQGDEERHGADSSVSRRVEGD
jgi:hypothetical protein